MKRQRYSSGAIDPRTVAAFVAAMLASVSAHAQLDTESEPEASIDNGAGIEDDAGVTAASGDRFWLEFGSGYAFVLAGDVEVNGETIDLNGSGFGVGTSVGIQIDWLGLGGTFVYAELDGFHLGTIVGEIRPRLVLGQVVGYARLGFGLSWIRADGIEPRSASSIAGFTADLGFGLDVWLANFISLGIAVDTGLVRFDVPARDAQLGLRLTAMVNLGLHF